MSNGASRQLEREQEKINWQAEYYKGVKPVTLTRQLRRHMERRATKRVKQEQVTGAFSRPDPYGNRHKRRRDASQQPKMLAIGLKALFG